MLPEPKVTRSPRCCARSSLPRRRSRRRRKRSCNLGFCCYSHWYSRHSFRLVRHGWCAHPASSLVWLRCFRWVLAEEDLVNQAGLVWGAACLGMVTWAVWMSKKINAQGKETQLRRNKWLPRKLRSKLTTPSQPQLPVPAKSTSKPSASSST